jgi:hypothetical protein
MPARPVFLAYCCNAFRFRCQICRATAYRSRRCAEPLKQGSIDGIEDKPLRLRRFLQIGVEPRVILSLLARGIIELLVQDLLHVGGHRLPEAPVFRRRNAFQSRKTSDGLFARASVSVIFTSVTYLRFPLTKISITVFDLFAHLDYLAVAPRHVAYSTTPRPIKRRAATRVAPLLTKDCFLRSSRLPATANAKSSARSRRDRPRQRLFRGNSRRNAAVVTYR